MMRPSLECNTPRSCSDMFQTANRRTHRSYLYVDQVTLSPPRLESTEAHAAPCPPPAQRVTQRSRSLARLAARGKPPVRFLRGERRLVRRCGAFSPHLASSGAVRGAKRTEARSRQRVGPSSHWRQRERRHRVEEVVERENRRGGRPSGGRVAHG
eukprot:CAMPEP_0184380010 /NCGR_PEP_ID=MMETSP0007-20130409/4373_1 /TAXON_ID=97485 /ORGANISM="Prymnesium parvum, Strain Texoma1" /LENGTH=154 /DNA_ID=CAMNT_0026725025 /DNA_START=115 /DNA_END=575 /DNA_ORIENTATION=+